MSNTGVANIAIRKATLDDVIGIVYVQATTWIKDYPSEENGISEEDIRSVDFKAKIINWQHLIRSPNYQVWVAATKEKVVGFIAALKESDLAEVYELCVLPEHQGRGYGTRLWEQVRQWLGELAVKVRIISYHEPSATFYKQLGFTISTLGEVDFIPLPSGKNIPTIEMYNGSSATQPPASSSRAAAKVAADQKGQSEAETLPPKASNAQPNSPKLLSRSELAKISHVRASTIKYYTEVGLLPYKQADVRLARRYQQDEALTRLQKIQELRQQGLNIKEIVNRLQ